MQLLQELKSFIKEEILPLEQSYSEFTRTHLWQEFPELASLKEKARARGLWNLFLPRAYGDLSPGLSNEDYAHLAENMGRVIWCSEVFNCSAPDTGNMEVLAKYGSEAQRAKWLKPLMEGTIRSAFLMTEPDVASSDARNVQTSIVREGNEYVINGRKWWSSGAMHPHCKVFIVMGKTDPTASSYQQQSMILVPVDTEGVKVVRPLSVFGSWDSPEGHAEVELNEVRVPATNLILGEGRGFEIAQGRLGPGRIHHCMRLIGAAQRALEMMCKRATERSTFGRELRDYSSIRQVIAKSRCAIEQARLLTISAAAKIDAEGGRSAKDHIAMIKIVCPKMACQVIDDAIQVHGGMGVCQDTPLASMWAYARTLRLADGPDEVHMYQLGRNTIKEYTNSIS